ncbi:ABC transporter family substrate-binding protein [Streptacidiphilus jiangxiensis]|uniref:Peptide/nickel transport system substrate-binding protein n=1 Tax=Streptacidiphilus jiangxiensis TaxID=235985 RepID=A0A1H7FQ07_STRJI|nr:ABC transporter family substrate-binding protein [Streptacidiphilus jiangxiensis]SEK28196.1 peptide/nickel transport system substrate-binding protein [Streptacidiphilus jiangxiensis]
MSRNTLKLATAVALSAGLVLGASACSSSGGTAAPKATEKASTANDINTVPASQLKQGGTLNYPVDQYSTQWNVMTAESQNEGSIVDTMGPLMPQLFQSDAQGNITANPDYLTSATVATVGGKQVVTYEINPKAKWSDGTPITYKDFQVDWQDQNGSNPKMAALSTVGYNQIASVVQGKNAQEVVVTYSSPYAEWKGLFAPLYPASQVSTVDGFNNAYKNKIPVTAGPFKVQTMNATTKVVTVVRDPNWWGAKPVLDTINFRALDSSSTPGAFASGEIDFIDVGPSIAIYKQVKGVANTAVRVAYGANWRQAWINGKSPNLTDPNVRQAIFQALNRDAIAKGDLTGLPWVIKPLNNHFLVSSGVGYQDNSGDLGKFDPSAAGTKLDAAGWKMGSDGYRHKDGKTLEFNLTIPSGTPVATNESNVMTAMLKAVGVKLDTVSLDGVTFFNDLNAEKFDMTIFSATAATPYFPLGNVESSYQSPTPQNAGANISQIGSAQLDAALNKAGADTDVTQYYADINAADGLIWQEAVNLPLEQRPQIFAEKATLANFGAFGYQTTNWLTIGFTK